MYREDRIPETEVLAVHEFTALSACLPRGVFLSSCRGHCILQRYLEALWSVMLCVRGILSIQILALLSQLRTHKPSRMGSKKRYYRTRMSCLGHAVHGGLSMSAGATGLASAGPQLCAKHVRWLAVALGGT